MEKQCSKCQVSFECTNEKEGCWCEQLHVPLQNLDLLKKEYSNCLCPECLKTYSLPE